MDDMRSFPEALYAPELEQAVIGEALADANGARKAVARLRQEDFASEHLGQIFDAIRWSLEAHGAADPLLVEGVLRARGISEKWGGLQYLQALVASVPGTGYPEQYIALVADASLRRRMRAVGQRLEAAAGTAENAPAVLAQLIGTAMRLSDDHVHDGLVPAAKTAEHCATWLDDLIQGTDDVVGARLGIARLDKQQLHGLSDQRLVLLKGPTKFGKTTVAQQAAWVTAAESGHVAWFVLEGSVKHMYRRYVAWETGIPMHLMRPASSGILSEEQQALIRRARERYSQLPLYLTDQVREIAEIEAEVLRVANKERIELVVVDHAQLVTGGKGDGRVQQLEDVAYRLQVLANRIEAPLLLLSQVTIDPVTSEPLEKWARALGENCTLALSIYRQDPSEKKKPRHEAMQSPELWLVCDLARDSEPWGKCRCFCDWPTFRVYDQVGWERRQADEDRAGGDHDADYFRNL